MASQPEFGDIEDLRQSLRGTALGQASVALGELAHTALEHTPPVGTVATAALVSASLGFVTNAGATNKAPTPKHNVVTLKSGDSIWQEGLVYDQQHGGNIRTTVTEIEGLSHIAPSQVKRLRIGTVLTLPDKTTTPTAPKHKLKLTPVFSNGGAVYKPSPAQAPAPTVTPKPVVIAPKPAAPQTAPAETTPAAPIAPAQPAQPVAPVQPVQPTPHKVREAAVPFVTSTHLQPGSAIIKKSHKHVASAAEILGWECAPDSTHTLIGGSREMKIIHYLMLCNHDSLAAATGVEGNLDHENVGFDPNKKEGGGDVSSPTAAGSLGLGIDQLTPGTRWITEEAKYHVHGPELGFRTELVVMADEMKNVAPTGKRDVNAELENATDPSAAATIFEQDFEAPLDGGNLPNRQALAQQAVQEYQSLHPHGYTPIPAKPHHHKKPHHHAHHEAKQPAAAHQGVNGVIATEIEKLTHVSYSLSMPAGHEGILRWISDNPHFEASSDPDQDIDCGTATDTAIALSTGGRYLRDNNTTTMRSDPNYKAIPFSEVGPGDLIQPDPNHVEVVTGVKGDMIYTFGAHTSLVPQPDQVSPAAYAWKPSQRKRYLFLRYVGPGYPLGNTAEAPTPALTAALNGTLAPAPVAPPKPAAPTPKPETPSQAISTVHHRLHHHSPTKPVHPLHHHLVHLRHNRHQRIF